MVNFLIILLLIIIIILFWILSKSNFVDKKKYEDYYDLVPYKYNYNMFKCFDMNCLLNKSYECYKYCDKISEPGGKGRCRLKCMYYADIQASVLKWNNYYWNLLLPDWKKYALFNKKDPSCVLI